ncbi:GntR family transcriptional regulator [Micromonospora pattaloongensis]|uniref:GntR family transcriptional regulator n=2 Tax=Micromonospora pattaloongensis TaxID=405436 RepID=A0A1H3KQ24_9ACTN|nr:GntR family transcriptional regulator [Micromonospora pattaloongensis]
MVADELRRRIAAGASPAGALLPSETALMAEFRVSRGTVREAISLLRAEGLVVTEHGRGSYARPALPVRRITSERYGRELDQLRSGRPIESPFPVNPDLPWSHYRLEKDFREVAATTTRAELFDVEVGTPLLERRFVFHAYGLAQQMSTSCLLLEMVTGTPLVDPDGEPWPGETAAQLHRLGITVTGVRERVRARMPDADEVDMLQLPSGVPVVTVTRQTYAGDRVVEVATDIVMPADRVELDYWITVD